MTNKEKQVKKKWYGNRVNGIVSAISFFISALVFLNKCSSNNINKYNIQPTHTYADSSDYNIDCLLINSRAYPVNDSINEYH